MLSASNVYTGMIYINVGEICFIPMNAHNELFNCVRQLRWQHLPCAPVVTTVSTSIRLLSSFFIKHCILPPQTLSLPLSLSFCQSVSLSLSVVPHSVFLIGCISLRFGDVDVFFWQSKVICRIDTFTSQLTHPVTISILMQ